MAPRPEARMRELLSFHHSEDTDDTLDGDDVFGETFAMELGALEHTLDEFSDLLNEEPHSKEPQEIAKKKPVIEEDDESISDLFADEVNALDDILEEFTRLVENEAEEQAKRPSISEREDIRHAKRKRNHDCNDENEIGLEGTQEGDTIGWRRESVKCQLDAVLMEMELEDETDEYIIHLSESLDSIYTIGPDHEENKKQPESTMVSNSWQCDAMKPIHELLATMETPRVHDDDTLFSLRQRYTKETVIQSLLNIFALRREQLEIDFPMLLRQLEEEGTSLANTASCKKGEEQSSYFSFIHNFLEYSTGTSVGTPRMDTLDTLLAYSEGNARLDTLESLYNYSREQTSLCLMHQKSTWEGTKRQVNSMSCNAMCHEPSSIEPNKPTWGTTSTIIDQMTASARETLAALFTSNLKVSPRMDTLDTLFAYSQGNSRLDTLESLYNYSREQTSQCLIHQQSKLASTTPPRLFAAEAQRSIHSKSHHFKAISHRKSKEGSTIELGVHVPSEAIECNIMSNGIDCREEIESTWNESIGQMDMRREGNTNLIQPSAMLEDTWISTSDSFGSGNDDLHKQSRPYRIFTKFDLDNDEEDFRLDDGDENRDDIHIMIDRIFTKFDLDDDEEDFRLDDGDEHRDDINMMRMRCKVDEIGQESRDDVAMMHPEFFSHQLEDTAAYPTQGSSFALNYNYPNVQMQEQSRPYKIFTKFDLDDDEEEDGSLRIDEQAEYFATMETPRVRNSNHPPQNSHFTFQDSKSSEFSSVGSNVWGQWPFFAPRNDPEDMMITHPPPSPQQYQQASGFILQQDTDLSTLSGSFSLEFDPIDIARQSAWANSPYLLRLLGSRNFFPEEGELEYQCFQTPMSNHYASFSRNGESRSLDHQRDQDEQEDRDDLYEDELIHGRRVLSPKNSAVFDTRDSPPDDIVIEKGIEDGNGSASVSTVGNGSIVCGDTSKQCHTLPAPPSENMVDKILLEQCPSEASTGSLLLQNVNSMVDAGKRLLNQILVGAE